MQEKLKGMPFVDDGSPDANQLKAELATTQATLEKGAKVNATLQAKLAKHEGELSVLKKEKMELSQFNAEWETAYTQLMQESQGTTSDHSGQLEALRAKKKAKIAQIRQT